MNEEIICVCYNIASNKITRQFKDESHVGNSKVVILRLNRHDLQRIEIFRVFSLGDTVFVDDIGNWNEAIANRVVKVRGIESGMSFCKS